MDADTANRSQIDRSVIQSAWADIQQLPAPWDTPAPTTAPPAPLQVVEFGQLDDDLVVGRDRIGEVVVADQFEDEVLPDIEPTELDLSDDEVTTTTEAASTKSDSAQPVRDSSNPFAEEFDEEEVVLDNFASWDNMFHSDALRVENRRDPEFAALVQAAVSEADVNETVACASTGAALRMLEEDSEEYDSTATELAVSKVPDTDVALDCQRPRLAIVSDSASETREPTSSVDDAAFSSDDWNASNSESREVASWSPDDWSDGEHLANQTANHHEEPVLIVEDDTAAPKPPVRREEYRNLFSRLRSG